MDSEPPGQKDIQRRFSDLELSARIGRHGYVEPTESAARLLQIQGFLNGEVSKGKEAFFRQMGAGG